MKKALMVILATVMALTLVLGSVTTASAAAPAGTISTNMTITRVDVATQTIYFTVSWKNLPPEMAAIGFIARFYPNGTGTFSDPIAVSSKSFTKAKTSYTSPEMSAVTHLGHTFQSGEYIQGTLDLRDANDGSIFPSLCQSASYLVPYPAGTISTNMTITRTDVATQTIYYTVSWKNLPPEMAVSGFVVRFYPQGVETLSDPIAVSSKSFTKAKTSYTSPEMSAVTHMGHIFQSGDYIQGTLDILDTYDNSIMPNPYYASIYHVP